MPTTSPPNCSYAVMAQRGTNEVVLLNTGNWRAYTNLQNQTWTWNGANWTLSASNVIVPRRIDYAMAYDGYNVVMFGGRGETQSVGVQNDTWVWNGTTWTKLAPTTSPFGRWKAEMALISGSLTTVMFGGMNMFSIQQETWLWNGNTQAWTLASPTSSPAARYDFMFGGGPTFCVLFGGKNTNSCMNDTWKFDGTNWTQLTPSNSPSVRAEASFCYDTAHSQWVMFGGRDSSGAVLAETWTLNSAGTACTKQAPATSPVGRVGAEMCYDSNTGAVLMFGGTNQAGNVNQDTWKWNGTTWTQL